MRKNVVSIRKYEEEEEEPKYGTQNQASWFILKFMDFAESNSIYAMAEIMNLHIILNAWNQRKASSLKSEGHVQKASKSVYTLTCGIS